MVMQRKAAVVLGRMIGERRDEPKLLAIAWELFADGELICKFSYRLENISQLLTSPNTLRYSPFGTYCDPHKIVVSQSIPLE